MRRSARLQRETAARWILIDLARWQADHRMRQAITDLNTCHAIWRLPAQQPRKETGQ
ncbi:hypothetical protein ACWENA_08440 [Streptomyces sp. NPDC004779]